MVLSDTSLLVVSILVSVSSPSRGDVLNDDEDLDTVLCLPLEKVIQPVPLVSRSAEVELRRYPTRELPSSLHASISLPPVVDVDPVLGHVDSSTQVPEVITLPSAITVNQIDAQAHSVDEPLRSHIHPQRGKRVKTVPTGPHRLRRDALHANDELVHLPLLLAHPFRLAPHPPEGSRDSPHSSQRASTSSAC